MLNKLRNISKRLLPQSLFGRALMILVLPTVLIQMVVAYVFFERHWDNVTRHMSSTLAGEIAFFVHQLKGSNDTRQQQLAEDFETLSGIDVTFDSVKIFSQKKATREFPEFQMRLRNRIKESFTVRKIQDDSVIEVAIKLPDHTLIMETTVKKLESPTTNIFLLWMIGASVLFLMIAVVFLRNQIRPIRRLSHAAESFGRGIDMPDFRPSGAREVRRAARAFIVMRERIKRQLRTRTEMLAGISHDLRTPLTRMKLQLAMLGDSEEVREMNGDVQQMEHMIQEYLDFARGEGREEVIRISLRDMLTDIVADYQRLQSPVTLEESGDVLIEVRAIAMRRMLHNVIDNALRYGKRCEMGLRIAANYCEIVIDDEGPGIPAEKRGEVFKPFNRLERSRNVKTGGVGLGLTIARDIALAHGGSISLETSPRGGLRVMIRLPL